MPDPRQSGGRSARACDPAPPHRRRRRLEPSCGEAGDRAGQHIAAAGCAESRAALRAPAMAPVGCGDRAVAVDDGVEPPGDLAPRPRSGRPRDPVRAGSRPPRRSGSGSARAAVRRAERRTGCRGRTRPARGSAHPTSATRSSVSRVSSASSKPGPSSTASADPSSSRTASSRGSAACSGSAKTAASGSATPSCASIEPGTTSPESAGADAQRRLSGEQNGAGRATRAADDDHPPARLLRVAGVGQPPLRAGAAARGSCSLGFDIGASRVDGHRSALGLQVLDGGELDELPAARRRGRDG